MKRFWLGYTLGLVAGVALTAAWFINTEEC